MMIPVVSHIYSQTRGRWDPKLRLDDLSRNEPLFFVRHMVHSETNDPKAILNPIDSFVK